MAILDTQRVPLPQGGRERARFQGRIEIANAPANLRFTLNAYFLACPAGAPPPARAPADGAWDGWPGGSQLLRSDTVHAGEDFTAALAPGHYQLLITATPRDPVQTPGASSGAAAPHLLLTGTELENRLMSSWGDRFDVWPAPQAVQVEAGELTYVKLQIECPPDQALPFPVPPGPQGMGSYSGTSLRARTGELFARYRAVHDLGNQGRFDEALAASEGVTAELERSALPRADVDELRMVVALTRVHALLQLKRLAAARATLKSAFLHILPDLQLEACDPSTAWGVYSAAGAVVAEIGPYELLPRTFEHAFKPLRPFLERGGELSDRLALSAANHVLRCLRLLRGYEAWYLMLETCRAIAESPKPPGLSVAIGFNLAYTLEAQLATDQKELVAKWDALISQHGMVNGILACARQEKLKLVLAHLGERS